MGAGRRLGLLGAHCLYLGWYNFGGWLKVEADGSLEIKLMVFKPLSKLPLRFAQVHERVVDMGTVLGSDTK